MAGTYENVTRNSPTFRMTVDDKDKIDAFTLVDFRLVVGRCHGSPFCVHLLQEKDYFYRDNTEIILNYEEVKSLVDAYSGLNAVKDRIRNYTGKYSFVNWHLKNGWSFGEKLKVHVEYRKVFRRVTFLIEYQMYSIDENGFQTCIHFWKRTLRDMHKIFLQLLIQFSSTDGSPTL